MRAIMIVLLLLLAAHTAYARDRIITNDNGGLVRNYISCYEADHLNGTRVVINGWCASACTLALLYPKTCVTPKAKLAFHAPSPQTKTEFLMITYPPLVQEWIDNHGGLTQKMIVLKGSELTNIVRGCKS